MNRKILFPNQNQPAIEDQFPIPLKLFHHILFPPILPKPELEIDKNLRPNQKGAPRKWVKLRKWPHF